MCWILERLTHIVTFIEICLLVHNKSRLQVYKTHSINIPLRLLNTPVF